MSKKSGKLTLIEAISMAVGTMIGASIFSIFGVGAKIAGRDLPLAFVLSGFYALIVAYSYARLGRQIVSNAGPIAFILKGIGDNVITGALSILMWMTYVVSIAMFAKGFAGYFLPLFKIPQTPFNTGLVEILIIAFFTALNFFGSKAVGKAEFWIVLIKLSILGLFILGGLLTIKKSYIAPVFDAQHLKGLLNASVIFFLSYMGFGLITNASENMENPEKNVPRAIYWSIFIVMLVYIGVAVVAIGNLPVPEIIKAEENALAEAAKPFLGNFGFLLVSIGALFSISSALNATLYGGANISYSLAKDGELPKIFERKIWFKSTEGLYITAGLSILFVLLFNIGQIASITSSIFTIIYIFVLFSHIRLVDKVGGNRVLLWFNLFVIVAVFGALLYFQYVQQAFAFWGTIVTIGGAVLLEWIYRKLYKERAFKEPKANYEK